MDYYFDCIFIDLEEVSEKTLHLLISLVGVCEKERLQVVLRAVHAILELYREKQCDETRVSDTLVGCKFWFTLVQSFLFRLRCRKIYSVVVYLSFNNF